MSKKKGKKKNKWMREREREALMIVSMPLL